MDSITLSLVSHTNVGKTTLARTLLRRDVGEVLDQAHVTEVNEAHELLSIDGAQLALWDTPGFGDTARLLRRLRSEGNPVGWFLHEVWDRLGDRALWCSQEAVRNVREDADVVLYLVNATEDPRDAGYVNLELELLTWLERPVVLLLNQTGPEDAGELERRWRAAVQNFSIVRDVLPLDAFTRSWVAEGELLRRLVAVLPDEKRAVMRRLADAWRERNEALFRASCAQLASHVGRAALERHGLPSALAGKADKQRAMEALAERQQRAMTTLMDTLIAEHGLDGSSAAEIRRFDHDFAMPDAPLDSRTGALWGSVVSGAVGGLAADALTGGLSLGGGMLAGAIVGALGGAGLARGYRLVGSRGKPAVRWSPEFLDQLTHEVLLRYLAVSHFGRGRGSFRDEAHPATWRVRVEEALLPRRGELSRLWKQAADQVAEKDDDGAAAGALAERLESLLQRTLRAVLASER